MVIKVIPQNDGFYHCSISTTSPTCYNINNIDQPFILAHVPLLLGEHIASRDVCSIQQPTTDRTGTLTSPFIIAIREAGSPIFADILTVIVFITVMSASITSFYFSSRCLTHMSDLGIIHPIFKAKDSVGRPWLSLIVSSLLGGGLTYLNLDSTSKEVYAWFSSLVTQSLNGGRMGDY